MSRKKNKLLKALGGIANKVVSGATNEAISMIPDAHLRNVAKVTANAVGSAVTGKKKRRKAAGGGQGVQSQIAPRTIGFSNAPNAFGATVSGNYFVTKQIDKDTLRIWGKVQFAKAIVQVGPAIADQGCFDNGSSASDFFVFNPLNAASDDVESRLGKTAQTYKSFAWRQLQFEYVPSVGTDSKGEFTLAVSWDPTQPVPAQAADLLNFEDSMQNPAWKPASFPVSCPDPGLKEAWSFNQQSQATAATIRQNYACQLMGRLNKTDQTPVDSETWGTLALHYCVDFFKPYIDDTEMTFMTSLSTRLGRLSPDAFCHVKAMIAAVSSERTRQIEAGTWKDQNWAKMESNLPTILIIGAKDFGERDLIDKLRYQYLLTSNGKLKFCGCISSDSTTNLSTARPIDLYQLKGPTLPHTVLKEYNENLQNRIDALVQERIKEALKGLQPLDSPKAVPDNRINPSSDVTVPPGFVLIPKPPS